MYIVLQEDGNAEDDPVIAFLEAEMREQPSMLDMEGFQELVRRFSDLAGILAEEVCLPTSNNI